MAIIPRNMIYIDALTCIQTNEFDNAHVFGLILYDISCFANYIAEHEMAKKYLELSCEMGHKGSMRKLGDYHRDMKNDEEMKKYYLMAIKNNNSTAMYKLGCYYRDKKNYSAMVKYFLMAVEKDNIHAMYQLGYYYNRRKNYYKMEKYYKMAVEKGDQHAMVNLGVYYHYIEKNYDEMKKCFLMAVEKKEIKAMIGLARYYEWEGKDIIEAIKYYEMAASCGNDLKHWSWRPKMNIIARCIRSSEHETLEENIENLKKVFPKHDKNNGEKECLICRSNAPYMFNLKCGQSYDHCYCISCFHEWYKNNDIKCIACFTNIRWNDAIFLYTEN